MVISTCNIVEEKDNTKRLSPPPLSLCVHTHTHALGGRGAKGNKYPSVSPSTEINKAFTCQSAREGHTVYAEQKRERHTQMHTHKW